LRAAKRRMGKTGELGEAPPMPPRRKLK